MKKLSEILPQVARNRNLSSDALASQILEKAEQYLCDIFGKENVGQGKNISGKKLQNGLMFFEVGSSAWNNRLFLEKEMLLESLRMEFPQVTLRDVRGRMRGEGNHL